MTLQDLKYRVLLKLGVVAAGDSPAPDDGATVELRYRSLHSLLTAEELADWNISEDIPDDFEAAIINMVAAECAGDFGSMDLTIKAEGKFGLPEPSASERQLRRLASRTYVSKPVETEYF